MNSELEELYQQVLLDHSKRPRNYGELEGDAIRVDGDNPSCGDEIHLHVRFGDAGAVEEIKFTGQGCAISQASASMMTLKLKGKSREEAGEMLKAFHDLVTEEVQEPPRMLGDLRVMQGVRKFPQRVKCAMLAWRAFEQARESLERGTLGAVVSTEQPEGPAAQG
jgi:nitrogen fixation NifU-like protein